MIEVKVRREEMIDAISIGFYNPEQIPALIDLVDEYGIKGVWQEDGEPLFEREEILRSQVALIEGKAYFEIITE